MSKRSITQWYIGAWVVWVVSLVAIIVLTRATRAAGDPPANLLLIYTTLLGAAFVMFVTWVVALVKLARRQAMFSFVVMLVLQLVGLGIVGMVAYGLSGPEEISDFAVRPRVS